jgi:hypothetical protein
MTENNCPFGTKAQTWQEAEQLERFTIYDYADWHHIAKLVNGYELAKQKGQPLKLWGREQHLNWRNTKQWNLGLIELLMMLFYFWSQEHMTGGTSWGEETDSILHEIARLTGQKYVTNYTAIREEAENRQNELLNGFRFISIQKKDEN